MYTSLVLFALAAPAAEEKLTWGHDYQAARKECASKGKPMAVFLGSGKAGPDKVVRGGLNGEAQRLLADGYVCVAIDTSTEAGRGLAERFEMPTGQGLVISDHTGKLQAFRHEGELGSAELGTYLRRYADHGHVVQNTETATTGRTSYYAGPGGEEVAGRMSYYAGPGVPAGV